MREGWQTLSGEELTMRITKGSSPKWQGFEYQSEGVLFVTSENVRDGFLDVSEPKYLPYEFSQKARNSRLKNGDILVNIVGASIGRACLFNLKDVEANVNQAVCVLRLKPDFEAEFFLQLLQAPHVQRRLLGERSDSARPNLSLTDFREFSFELPPLAEQRKIAEILRTWDEALEKLSALRAAKLKRHRGLTMALVFGGWQLDRFRKTDEVTPYRWFRLPDSWSCQHIGDLATEISERSGEGGQHEVLSCSKYEGFVRSLEYFKKQVFSADLSGYKKIWRGDFGFPSNHVEEGSIGLQNLTDIGVVSPIYTVFRFNPDQVNAEFAFAVLKTELYRHIFEVSTSASVDRRGSLRWSEFSRLPFPVPPLGEQKAIADVLRTSQCELNALTDEIEAVSRQKRGLMQKLLTGEWRVKQEAPVA